MTITELVLLILNFTSSCIVCLWLSLLKQKLNTTRSMCNVERAPYYIACTITIETHYDCNLEISPICRRLLYASVVQLKYPQVKI